MNKEKVLTKLVKKKVPDLKNYKNCLLLLYYVIKIKMKVFFTDLLNIEIENPIYQFYFTLPHSSPDRPKLLSKFQYLDKYIKTFCDSGWELPPRTTQLIEVNM